MIGCFTNANGVPEERAVLALETAQLKFVNDTPQLTISFTADCREDPQSIRELDAYLWAQEKEGNIP